MDPDKEDAGLSYSLLYPTFFKHHRCFYDVFASDMSKEFIGRATYCLQAFYKTPCAIHHVVNQFRPVNWPVHRYSISSTSCFERGSSGTCYLQYNAISFSLELQQIFVGNRLDTRGLQYTLRFFNSQSDSSQVDSCFKASVTSFLSKSVVWRVICYSRPPLQNRNCEFPRFIVPILSLCILIPRTNC